MSSAPGDDPAGAELEDKQNTVPVLPTVSAVIALVIAALPSIGKSGSMVGPVTYQYRTIEDIKAALKAALALYGLVYLPHKIVTVDTDQVPVGSKGTLWWRTRVLIRWRLVGPSGDHLEAESYGIGFDAGDKSGLKAAVSAEKSFLLSTFCIADAAPDPDHTRPELDGDEPAPTWPAKAVKVGMLREIANRVTDGNVERAKELAALAWETFGLAEVTELEVDEAREKIDAAVELARQETIDAQGGTA